MTTTYYPESYVSPCVRCPYPFDYAIDKRNEVAILECRKLCGQCHPDHARKCLEDNPTVPGVVAGLTLEQRTQLRKAGSPLIPIKYRGDLRRRT